jgi:hypothetical protein
MVYWLASAPRPNTCTKIDPKVHPKGILAHNVYRHHPISSSSHRPRRPGPYTPTCMPVTSPVPVPPPMPVTSQVHHHLPLPARLGSGLLPVTSRVHHHHLPLPARQGSGLLRPPLPTRPPARVRPPARAPARLADVQRDV